MIQLNDRQAALIAILRTRSNVTDCQEYSEKSFDQLNRDAYRMVDSKQSDLECLKAVLDYFLDNGLIGYPTYTRSEAYQMMAFRNWLADKI